MVEAHIKCMAVVITPGLKSAALSRAGRAAADFCDLSFKAFTDIAECLGIA